MLGNSQNAMLCDVMLCDVMLCDAMLCDAMLCDAMLCDAMLCNAMLCDVMLCDDKILWNSTQPMHAVTKAVQCGKLRSLQKWDLWDILQQVITITWGITSKKMFEHHLKSSTNKFFFMCQRASW